MPVAINGNTIINKPPPMTNKQLPATTLERIKADALLARQRRSKDLHDKYEIEGYEEGYIAGATAMAESAQNILINALEDAKGKLEYYGDAIGVADIDEALQQWKDQKEVGNG